MKEKSDNTLSLLHDEHDHEVVVFREKYYWLITAREELSGWIETQVDALHR
jgi:hypothetical protein